MTPSGLGALGLPSDTGLLEDCSGSTLGGVSGGRRHRSGSWSALGPLIPARMPAGRGWGAEAELAGVLLPGPRQGLPPAPPSCEARRLTQGTAAPLSQPPPSLSELVMSGHFLRGQCQPSSCDSGQSVCGGQGQGLMAGLPTTGQSLFCLGFCPRRGAAASACPETSSSSSSSSSPPSILHTRISGPGEPLGCGDFAQNRKESLFFDIQSKTDQISTDIHPPKYLQPTGHVFV